jgi:tetratricopeptide (TPR) repeat protein
MRYFTSPLLMLFMSIFWGCAAPSGPAPGSQIAEIQALEVESAARLAMEGQIGYQSDIVKKDGYQYCGDSFSLADRGEFRLAIRAASKALFLGQRQNDEFLVANAKRDLAYAYFLAGNLDRAEAYAEEALTHAGHSRSLHVASVIGPSTKLLGDIALRKGKPEEAISFYAKLAGGRIDNELLRASLANARLATGDFAGARKLFNEAANLTKDKSLLGLVHRGLGDVALAEGKHEEAISLYGAAVIDADGPDFDYQRFWSFAGIGRAKKGSGDTIGAISAYLLAIKTAENIRARFRSEEFKTGFFGDAQQVFDEAIALLADAGDVERSLEISERSRARAMSDFVRGRISNSEGTKAIVEPFQRSVPLQTLRTALPDDLTIVEYHQTRKKIFGWVVRKADIRLFTINRSREQVLRDVRIFREESHTLSSPVASHGPALYALLIAPAELLAHESIVLIPHSTTCHSRR